MSILLAVTLAGGMAGQDPASLLARIEALEARNRDLEARLERLDASTAPSTSQPPAVVVPATAQSRPSFVEPMRDTWDVSYVGLAVSERELLNQERYVSNYYAYSAPDRTSAYVSLQAGRRWQSGSWVFGGEVSASAPIGPSSTELYDVKPPFSTPDTLYRWRRPASVAVSGQLGWTFGDTLLYSTAGIEVAQLKFVRPTEPLKGSSNVAAPFFGLGVAHQLHDRLSIELEGRYGYFEQGLMDNDFALALKLNYLVR